jgi:parallel beta-helix repeat protein
MMALLLVCIIMLTFKVRQVEADAQTVCINADGSITPSGAPIATSDNTTYTFTGHITYPTYYGIGVQRNNIIIDGKGYTMQGHLSEVGLNLTGISNVTIKNINIKSFWIGLWLVSSSRNNSINGNNITNNDFGISLDYYSSNNNISENNITGNYNGGIQLYLSGDNSISGNIVTDNTCGIHLYESTDNNINGNNITANSDYGIMLATSTNNINENNITGSHYGLWLGSFCVWSNIYHNNFLNNTQQVYSTALMNVWDDGYPSGGNYWSDCNGTDLYSGAHQNETGSDGICDASYVIDSNNIDNYPLVQPFPAHNIAVNTLTATQICKGYGYLTTLIVTDKGDFAEVFNITVYANFTDTGNVTAIAAFKNVSLNSRDSAVLTFMWDTLGFALGDYIIIAVATPVQGETNVADNTFMSNTVQITQATGGSGGRMPYMN